MKVEKTLTIEATEVKVPWWEQPFFGIPTWIWLAGGTTLITVIGVAAYQEEERRRMMLLVMAR